MPKEIKGFITRDDFVNSNNSVVSPIYELSDIGSTYAKSKMQYYASTDPLYGMTVFKMKELTGLTQDAVDNMIDVVKKFSAFLTSSLVSNKQQSIILFLNNYNSANPTKQVTDFNYNTIVSHNNIKTVDYITFVLDGISSNFWLSDEVFKAFYPEYDINVVLPFANFSAIVNNTSEFITALDKFDLIEFNRRVEVDKNNIPSTYTKMVNIPYRVPNTTVEKNCYFAFNIYGLQGNYDYILKLELYNHLVNVLGMNATFVESIFPTILNINEFFITPRWEKMAIPSQIGQNGINSQIAKAFSAEFDLTKFIKIYPNASYLRENTYGVPFDYNNLLLQVTNGFYTEAAIKDFADYYSDFITITSTHPDFARMKQRTQKFIVLLENLLDIANSSNSTEMFNKILQNNQFHITIISRAGVNYISFFFEEHQYYVLPRYEFLSLV